jgi:hypothetical protein
MMIRRLIAGVVLACVGAVAWVLACGPFVEEIPTVAVVQPANLAAYARGDVGVVRPRLARRYLVQAYRVLSGLPPLEAAIAPLPEVAGASGDADLAQGDWQALAARITGSKAQSVSAMRKVPFDQYQDFLNCPDAAFATAARTLRARIERYGESSAAVKEWISAQQIVFANCADGAAIPPPASATADALARADRDYQIASAYFYATQYEEAARRFHAIGADAASPWRAYGGYLAARAMIRSATLPDDIKPEEKVRRDERLAAAETELNAVVANPAAAAAHAWARQKLDYIALRIHPFERLHAISRVLSATTPATWGDLDEYRWLMNELVGDSVNYPYPGVDRRDQMAASDDLTDWILAMQGEGAGADERAVSRWQATRSMPWLAATLWNVRPGHPSVDAALDAARAVDHASAAFPTVAFLRVRLLARVGRRDEARRDLATLPSTPGPGIDAETLNLLRAERVMLADSLDEFLASAPRAVVMNEPSLSMRGAPPPNPHQPNDQPVIGDDAAVALNDWFPLNRLVDAAVSPMLPPRIRVRVANAAFSRAFVLRRDAEALRIAPVLRELAPKLGADIDRFVNAANADERHAAGVFLFLRTPGMHAMLETPEDDFSYKVDNPDTEFDRLLHRNWWCELDLRIQNGKVGEGSSELLGLLYQSNRVPAPSFLSVEERAAADREMKALAAVHSMRSYLGAEALTWVRTKPRGIDVAEALAQTVQGWRFGCGDDGKWDIARQAFNTLQRLFPQSDAANRTKYWYK